MFYGQLLHIFAINFPEAEVLAAEKPETILFAAKSAESSGTRAFDGEEEGG
ncbi:hypothetical protein RSAG8_03659, partial [Rhizoctonia solani AG-8 WAC10335]